MRGLSEKTQKAHIRNVRQFAAFLGRSPDLATPEELRSYLLRMTENDPAWRQANAGHVSLPQDGCDPPRQCTAKDIPRTSSVISQSLRKA
ncbi:phage integrase N-terminal SAM-like domain-containing protein [Thioclava sp.]|uniref:phage integrase N-terminal SAM-like domain-containing protein n=1 Tax=Thioclava sp. TaxID=1933450 RepID=UPI003AA8E270